MSQVRLLSSELIILQNATSQAFKTLVTLQDQANCLWNLTYEQLLAEYTEQLFK